MSSDLERRALEESDFDVLGTAMEMTGNDPRAASALGFLFAQVNAERRKMLWQEVGDVYRNMDWYKFQQMLSDRDFVVLKRWRFPYRKGARPEDEITQPEALIASNVGRKLLLVANSDVTYEGVERLSNGSVHGCVQGEDLQCFNLIRDMRASGGFSEDRWKFELAVEDGLFTRLAMIEESGATPSNWNCAITHVRFGDYSNVGDNTYDSRHSFKVLSFEQIMENHRVDMVQFLSEVPPEVRAFMS